RRLALELQRIVATQLDPIWIANRRHRREPVERAAQDNREKARVAAFRTCKQRRIGPGEQRARAEQQAAARRSIQHCGHDHLLWNSGAINTNVTACALLSARATAWRVVGVASGPSVVSRTALGSSRSAAFCAKALAESSRWARPSSQALLSSENPFGAGGRHRGSPNRLVPCTSRRPSPARSPAARRIATYHSPGRLILARSGDHDSGAVTSAFETCQRSPSVSMKRCVRRSTSA